jgi:GT2 family glycosyltransferase
LLLNNDSLAEKNFLSEMLHFMNDSRAGAVVPKIYFTKGHEFHKQRYSKVDEGKVLWFAGGFIDWKNVMSVHEGVDEVDHGQYNEAKKINFATGACLLLKRQVLDKYGLFDKRYFLYYEDADLSQKILKNGYEIYYVPKAILWHNNAGSSGSGSELHDYFLTRNRMLFGMKYAPLRAKAALVRESFRLLANGRKWQKIGIRDYYLKKFGKGSYIR